MCYVVVLVNGMFVLDVVLKVLNVGFGDEVIVMLCMFIVSIFFVVNVGVMFVFVDVEVDSGNLLVEIIVCVVMLCIKVVVCVYFVGWLCDMDLIMVLVD